MRRFLAQVILGTVVFLLTIGSPKALDVAVGAAVSAAVSLVARRHLEPEMPAPAEGPPLLRRVAAAPGLVWATLREVAKGTRDVARVSLRPGTLHEPGFVEVPLHAGNDVGITASALLLTLSPGSFVVDVDTDRGVMIVHVLDASDPDRLRAVERDIYERHQRQVLP